jgi:hypothetical protein
MPRSALAQVVAAAVSGCLLLPLLAPAEAVARSVPCPDRHDLTVRDLLALAPQRVDGYWGESPRARACYGGATLTVRGYANWPEGLGGTSVSGIRPAWFEWPTFYLFASSRELAPGFGRGAFYGIAVPPRLGAVEQRYHRTWVIVTARFEHPLATRCRGYGPRDDRPTRTEAVAACRDRLVLLSVTRFAGPPATDAVTGVDAVTRRTPPPAVPAPAAPLLAIVALAGALAGWRRSDRIPT